MVSPLTKKFERRSESIQREVSASYSKGFISNKEGGERFQPQLVAAVTHSLSISVCPQHQQSVYEGLQTTDEFHHHPHLLILIPIFTYYIHFFKLNIYFECKAFPRHIVANPEPKKKFSLDFGLLCVFYSSTKIFQFPIMGSFTEGNCLSTNLKENQN